MQFIVKCLVAIPLFLTVNLLFAAELTQKPFSGFGLGLNFGANYGSHLIDLEAMNKRTTVSKDNLTGFALGLSIDYLLPLGDWRVGPRWTSERTNYQASDWIGNKYADFDTSLELKEAHTASLVLGKVQAETKLMLYVFAGVGVSRGSLAANLRVMNNTAKEKSLGWLSGPIYGIGVRYLWSEDLEFGVEYAHSKFHKDYYKCKQSLCVGLPIKVEPKTIKIMLIRRF